MSVQYTYEALKKQCKSKQNKETVKPNMAFPTQMAVRRKKFTVQFTCDFGHKSNFTFEYQPCRTIDDTSGQCALENIKLAFLVLVKNFDDGFNYHDIKNTCTIIWCAFADGNLLYCTVLYCAVLYCTELFCTVLCCAVL